LTSVYLPVAEQKVLDAKHWVEPVKTIRFEAHAKLQKLFQKVIIGVGSTVGEALALSLEEANSRIRTLLKPLREGGRYDITPGRMAKQRELHINVLTESSLLTYLLIGDHNVDPPVGVYYQAISVNYLKAVWNLSTDYLLDDTNEGNPNRYRKGYLELHQNSYSGSLGYTGYVLDESVLSELIELLREKTIEVLRSSAIYIEKHNAYADYIVVILYFGLGTRPVLDPFPLRRWFNRVDRLALMQDKHHGSDPSYRMGPLGGMLCDQLNYYDDHLVAFASTLFNSGSGKRNLAKCIFDLANKKTPPQSIPYLFRLSYDGKEVIHYRRSDLSRILGADVEIPDNYPRKFFYMECVRAGVPDTVIRSMIGHATTRANLLGSDSVHSLRSELKKVEPIINAGLQRIGFETVKGIRAYGIPDFNKVNPNSDADFIPRKRLLGYELRHREQIKIKLKAKDFLRESESIIELRLGLDIQTFDNYRAFDKKSFRLVRYILKRGINSASSSRSKRIALRAYKLFQQKIKSASRFSRELRRYVNRISPFSERITLSEKRFLTYCDATSLRTSFLNYIDTRKYSDEIEILRAELVIAAAVFSYIADPELLKIIGRLDLSPSFSVDGSIFIDLPSLVPNTPLYRWKCDKVSSLIIAKLLKRDEPSVSGPGVENGLRSIISRIGEELSGGVDGFSYLSSLSSSLVLFELGGAWYQGQINCSSVQSLSKRSFFAYTQNSKPAELPITNESSEDNGSSVDFGGIVESRVRKQRGIKEIEGCFTLCGYAGPTIKESEKNVNRLQLADTLSVTYEAREGWSSACEYLCLWLKNMALMGTVARTNPTLSTLKTYFSLISPIAHVVGDADILKLSPEKYRHLYLAAYRINEVERAADFWTQVEQFHSFIRQYGAAPVIFDVVKLDTLRLSCRATYISIATYHSALSYVCSDGHYSGDTKFYIAALCFFGRRFGMRILEIPKLRLNDIQLDRARGLMFIRVREGVKTNQSRRQIPLLAKLVDEEIALLTTLLDRCELRKLIVSDNPRLLPQIGLDETIDAGCAGECLSILKKITADLHVNHRTLRHSWATDAVNATLTDLFLDEPANIHARFSWIFSYESNRALINISNSMGHADCSTILSTYYNTREIYLGDWYHFDSVQTLSLNGAVNISALKYHALARRMRVANMRSKNALAVISPADWRSVLPVTVVPLSVKLDIKTSDEAGKHGLEEILEWLIETDFTDDISTSRRLDMADRIQYQKVIERCNYIQNCFGNAFFSLGEDKPVQTKKSRKWLREATLSIVMRREAASPFDVDLVKKAVDLWFSSFNLKKPKYVLFNNSDEWRSFSDAWGEFRPINVLLKTHYAAEYEPYIKNCRGVDFQVMAESSQTCEKKGNIAKPLWVVFESYGDQKLKPNDVISYFMLIHIYLASVTS